MLVTFWGSVATLIVVFAFAFAGGAKLGELPRFQQTLRQMLPGLPSASIGTISAAIAVFECIVSLWIASGVVRFAALLVAAAMLLAFSVILFETTVTRGIQLHCHCFGDFLPTWLQQGAAAYWRNVGLVTLAGVGLLSGHQVVGGGVPSAMAIAVWLGAYVVTQRRFRSAKNG